MTTADSPSPLRVLVADDEESMGHFLERGLRRIGHQVVVVGNGEEAVERWTAGMFDLAVLDLKMPKCDGIQALKRIRTEDPEAIAILMTAHGTVATAVEAMHLGAADYVTKPFTIEELQVRIQRAVQLRATKRENRQLRAMLKPAGTGMGLIAQSPAMAELLRQLELLRDSSATVLLTGESGTGKSLVARTLHMESSRAGEPFVALNCAAMPDALVESELFGHEPGAFTDAHTRKTGVLARANRGTLLLDEIGDMSLAVQAKIERFLQEREFIPLGGTEPVTVDVRVVAATNRDLQEMVKTGQFRGSLLWRLGVVKLHVPPLRERREDIPQLIAQTLARLETPDHPKVILSREAMAALAAYDWPGNVRELQNVLERMIVLAGARGSLGMEDLPSELSGVHGGQSTGDDERYEAARNRFDRYYFTNLLMQCGGSITEAAERAGLSRGHMHRRLRDLGCDVEAARQAGRDDPGP